jgi:ABC-type sugar transport system ATPase subunit
MVFQNYALYPHMSVYNNIAFGLLLRYGGGVFSRGLRRIFNPRKSIELNRLRSGVDRQVRQTADRLAISNLLNRKPHQLSGGERQRVALGRAIVRDPAVFLFDEPLSNLDAKLRQQLRLELKRIHRDLQATMIYVTHDQVEAMTLGDRIAVMESGKVLQVGRPLEVYQRPANLFVAKFIGNTPSNIVTATLEQNAAEGSFSVVVGGRRFELGAACFSHASLQEKLKRRVAANASPAEVLIGFRAENGRLVVKESRGQRFESRPQWAAVEKLVMQDFVALEGVVCGVDRLGSEVLVEIRLEGIPVATKNSQQCDSYITVRAASDLAVEVDQSIWVDVAVDKLMWFDPETGENLARENT